jgi:cytochrome oxidase Cu insertion factor (SCO1/SenC/PrrC family)
MWGMHRTLRNVLSAVFVLLLATAACGEDGSNDAPLQDARAPASADESPRDDPPDDEPSADAAPDFSFETFEGEDFSLAEQRGTPVVLNFWESW